MKTVHHHTQPWEPEIDLVPAAPCDLAVADPDPAIRAHLALELGDMQRAN